MHASQLGTRMTSALLAVLASVLMPFAGALPRSMSVQVGQWALHGARPQIISKLTSVSSTEGTALDIVQLSRSSGALITNYELGQTRYMHLIVVRADFREFMHLHPLLSGGHFKTPVALSAGHRYYAFADSVPSGIGQAVFRFTLQAGWPPTMQKTKVAASLPTVAAGPYVVRLARTIVPAGRPFTLSASITRNGRFASDLQPYLGAAAHVVLIDTSDLTYLHVHPMTTGHGMTTHMAVDARAPIMPRMQLEIPTLARDAYKMWVQFRGAGSLYVAPFTLVAR